MGLGFFNSDMGNDCCRENINTAVNIEKFHITKLAALGKWTYVEANYPDCTNFKGNKVLVYYNIDPEAIMRAKELDPHFSDINDIRPIARFVPTAFGKFLAWHLVKSQGIWEPEA